MKIDHMKKIGIQRLNGDSVFTYYTDYYLRPGRWWVDRQNDREHLLIRRTVAKVFNYIRIKQLQEYDVWRFE